MKKSYFGFAFLLMLLASFGYKANSQVFTYVVNYTSASPTTTDATNWANYRALLAPLPYYRMRVIGGSTTAPIVSECLNPAIVQDIAMRLNTYNATTGGLWTWVDGANTWLVGNCSGMGPELALNAGSACACPSPGYVVRSACLNCVGNFGGWGTATCGGPAQTITVEFWYGTPCPLPTGYIASNLTSTSADVTWTAVPASQGYDWFVDQSGAYPAPTATFATTTATGISQTGLTPSTKYYLHIRNICNSTSKSIWDTFAFYTLPPCKPPVGFNVSNMTPTAGTIGWAAWPSALTYDYIVNQDPSSPGSSTGAINTAATTVNLTGLTENTCYYVHIRSRCAANEVSDWGLDSFCTPVVCRAPDIRIDHLNSDEAVAYWGDVLTAYQYEYALSSSSTPPAVGTIFNQKSIHASALEEGKPYFIHVRSHCSSLGILTTSPWGTATFTTWPLGINNAASKEFSISVSPNPVKDRMYIDLTGARKGTATITVVDVSGKVLKALPVSGNKVELDMSDMASGIYFVKYQDETYSDMIKVTKQ